MINQTGRLNGMPDISGLTGTFHPLLCNFLHNLQMTGSQGLTPFQDDLEDNAEPRNQRNGEEDVQEAEIISLTREFVKKTKPRYEEGVNVEKEIKEFFQAAGEANQTAGEVNQVNKGLYLKAIEFAKDGKDLFRRLGQVELNIIGAKMAAKKFLSPLQSTDTARNEAIRVRDACKRAVKEATKRTAQVTEEVRLAEEAYFQAKKIVEQAEEAYNNANEAYNQASRERNLKLDDYNDEQGAIEDDLVMWIERFFDEASELIDGPERANPMA
ncbi:hypothetical protein IWQ60_008582 [Tieghemiomyces parasiticus]|uniref:BAR domain-containing protein n=1 Tax=Tieghemiomyces parasiticus TaxID=78921 RepID=A0A9W7ZY12_9FUNG|nr:hypothetical protein IWQ60_008582 [Tieghemiomyces parasiticus]